MAKTKLIPTTINYLLKLSSDKKLAMDSDELLTYLSYADLDDETAEMFEEMPIEEMRAYLRLSSLYPGETNWQLDDAIIKLQMGDADKLDLAFDRRINAVACCLACLIYSPTISVEYIHDGNEGPARAMFETLNEKLKFKFDDSRLVFLNQSEISHEPDEHTERILDPAIIV